MNGLRESGQGFRCDIDGLYLGIQTVVFGDHIFQRGGLVLQSGKLL